MNRTRFNRWVFLLEALNALGTAYYFNYLFFYLKANYAFSSVQNLLVCALNGFVYMGAAYVGGRFGQARGYFPALILGCAIMLVTLAGSALAPGATLLLVLMAIWTVGMGFTWPNLEALAADRLPGALLPKTIGCYNVVWAGASAIAYFSGGSLAERLGWQSIFWVPVIIHFIQIAIAVNLTAAWGRIVDSTAAAHAHVPHNAHPRGPVFLQMARIANPFAYVAMNAVIPLIPELALRLGLSTTQAGVFCSVWFFARMFTFVVLAVWPGWHYRASHLLLSYAGMLLSFAAILLLNNIWWLLAAQVAFGWCVGLIYYSSLYYSMHVGETKGEHGGLHEAAIGAGIFGGPAIGAASLWLAPATPASGVIGVSICLAAGFGFLLRAQRLRAV